MPKLKVDTKWPGPAKVKLTKRQIEGLAASARDFDEIAATYGAETAIKVGRARDPDNPALDADWFKYARPAREVAPHLVDCCASRGKRRRRPGQGRS